MTNNKHLLIVEETQTINVSEIMNAKQNTVDVIVLKRNDLENISTLLNTQFGENTIWLSINLLIHGSYLATDETITICGYKMSVNRNIMEYDPGIIMFKTFMTQISKYTETIYCYACSIGAADGIKELCIKLSLENNMTKCIYLSTNITGPTQTGGDWLVEWGTTTGFLTDEAHHDEIYHYTQLFHSIPKNITLTTVTYTFISFHISNSNIMLKRYKLNYKIIGTDVIKLGYYKTLNNKIYCVTTNDDWDSDTNRHNFTWSNNAFLTHYSKHLQYKKDGQSMFSKSKKGIKYVNMYPKGTYTYNGQQYFIYGYKSSIQYNTDHYVLNQTTTNYQFVGFDGEKIWLCYYSNFTWNITELTFDNLPNNLRDELENTYYISQLDGLFKSEDLDSVNEILTQINYNKLSATNKKLYDTINTWADNGNEINTLLVTMDNIDESLNNRKSGLNSVNTEYNKLIKLKNLTDNQKDNLNDIKIWIADEQKVQATQTEWDKSKKKTTTLSSKYNTAIKSKTLTDKQKEILATIKVNANL
jgi:hypothetical protein